MPDPLPLAPSLPDLHAILLMGAHPWRCVDHTAGTGDAVIGREVAWRVGVARATIGLLLIGSMAALPLPHSGAMLLLGLGLLYLFSGWAGIKGDAYVG